MQQPHSSKDFDQLRRTASRFQTRAAKYHSQGDAVRPEELYIRALDIQQRLWGPDHQEVAHTLNNLALYYKQLGRLAEARPLYERALAIFRKSDGASHQNTATTMYNLAQLFKVQGKEMERRARQTEKDAREITDPATLARNVIHADLARYPKSSRT
jgi:tetratricopeptide (TPR) repeat protein